MGQRLLKITLLAVGAAAVLLFSGSGYAQKNEVAEPDSLQSALEGISAELPLQESADWQNAVQESPAFFFLLTAD